MEDDLSPATKHGAVELVVSPTVLKRGDSSGKNFQSELVLARARVVCGQLPIGEQRASST